MAGGLGMQAPSRWACLADARRRRGPLRATSRATLQGLGQWRVREYAHRVRPVRSSSEQSRESQRGLRGEVPLVDAEFRRRVRWLGLWLVLPWSSQVTRRGLHAESAVAQSVVISADPRSVRSRRGCFSSLEDVAQIPSQPAGQGFCRLVGRLLTPFKAGYSSLANVQLTGNHSQWRGIASGLNGLTEQGHRICGRSGHRLVVARCPRFFN